MQTRTNKTRPKQLFVEETQDYNIRNGLQHMAQVQERLNYALVDRYVS
jgi:hypothetical protein